MLNKDKFNNIILDKKVCLLIGDAKIGKTHQILQYAIEQFIMNNTKLVLIVRYKEDTNSKRVERIFNMFSQYNIICKDSKIYINNVLFAYIIVLNEYIDLDIFNNTNVLFDNIDISMTYYKNNEESWIESILSMFYILNINNSNKFFITSNYRRIHPKYNTLLSILSHYNLIEEIS